MRVRGPWLGRAAGVATAIAAGVGVVLNTQMPSRPYGAVALGLAGVLGVLWAAACRGAIAAWFRRRSTRLGANSALLVTVVGAILVMINVLAVRHSARLDFSQTGAFTLAPQTTKILDALSREVKVTGFFQKGSEPETRFKDLLDTYRHYSQHISAEAIDPVTHPAAAKQYGITQYETIVVESGSQEARIRTANEQELTNALIRVGKDAKKRIAVLDGHGEPGMDDTQPNGFSQAKDALEREGYEVDALLLAQSGAVPSETAVLIVADPLKPLLPAEHEAVSRYVSGGGRVLLLLGPDAAADARTLAAPWGVTFRGDTIVDPVSRLFGGDYTTPVIRDYGSHDIVRDFRLATFFPLAQSLTFKKPEPADLEHQALAMTSAESWGETQIVGGKARFDAGQDARGPMDLAVAVSAASTSEASPPEGQAPPPTTAQTPGRAVVVGNARFATNGFFNVSGNGDLFAAAVNWLAEEHDAIAIRPKEAKSSPLFLSAGQQRFVFWIPVLVVPGLITVFGVVVWRRRRRL